MRIRPSILLTAIIVLAACNRDQSVPTSEDNRAMDAAAADLDRAANDLSNVDQRLPDTNESGLPAAASDPPRP